MTSFQNTSGSVTCSAICKNGVFPEGWPVVVRMNTGNFVRLNTNQATTRLRYYQPDAASPPGCIGSDGRSKASLLPSASIVRRTIRPHSTPARILNLGGAIGLHCLFLAPVKACKQSARCISKTFHRLLSVAVHAQQLEPGDLGNARISSGEIRNVVR